jgi:NAD(P)-dependent dehydrogenase (short-subunit alcohol dehydrogenase family)
MNRPVVLITGASQGIGAAIAKVFAREVRGVRLALVARSERTLGTVARTCARLNDGGAEAVEIFKCDVSDEADVAAMARAVEQRFGIVDVVINNALGPDIPVDVYDAATTVKLLTVAGNESKAVPKVADLARPILAPVRSSTTSKVRPRRSAL